MRILIAPNAFKGSITADKAADAIAEGFAASPLACEVSVHPIADGGDGTGALLAGYLGAQPETALVSGPLGCAVEASYGYAEPSHVGVIEFADAAGLRLLDSAEYDPLRASSCGVGELMLRALDRGARELLVGVGGSATVDGGAGLLGALGARFFDAAGRELQPDPPNLPDVANIDLSGLDDRLRRTAITVLCDVDNPLLGPDGAAGVFGPQKGADTKAVDFLERGLEALERAAFRCSGVSTAQMAYGGAAGGASALLHALLNARLVAGTDHFLDVTGFDDALDGCDVLVTGEGAIDAQTSSGKAPFGAASRAKARDLPVIAFCGRAPFHASPSLQAVFDCIFPIGNGPASLAEAQAGARQNLWRTAFQTGCLIALSQRAASARLS